MLTVFKQIRLFNFRLKANLFTDGLLSHWNIRQCVGTVNWISYQNFLKNVHLN